MATKSEPKPVDLMAALKAGKTVQQGAPAYRADGTPIQAKLRLVLREGIVHRVISALSVVPYTLSADEAMAGDWFEAAVS